jgi:PAS domain S-box-containing protein
LAGAIDRLIELDQQDSAQQQEKVAFLAMMDAVIEALPDGLVVTDIEGNIVLFNERAEFLFGRHRSEAIGQNVEMLMPERMRQLYVSHTRIYNKFDVSPQTRTMGLGLRLTGLHGNGHEFPADVTLSQMVVPSGVYNLALIRGSPRLIGPAAAETVTPQAGGEHPDGGS